MPWLRIDDDFAEHPKVAAVGELAAWLHMRMLCYCAKHLTDGFIPEGHVQQVGTVGTISDIIESLTKVHKPNDSALWEKVEGGYQIHDWAQYGVLHRSDARLEWDSLRRRLAPLVLSRDCHRCVICGSPSDLTIDHITPLSQGGGNSFENLQTACRSCNSKKGAHCSWPG